MTEITLEVNGTQLRADVPPRQHLADFLRENLRLTGTHLGCEHGVCGACTILVDGQPQRACITQAATCGDAHIRTIEGLEEDAVAARLRAAFSAHHALQCGYCTPGMMVTAWDIVHRLPDATDDQIRLELAGNLCRCTGYNGIVRAIRQVLDERVAPPPIQRAALPRRSFGAVSAPQTQAPAAAPSGQGLHQRLSFAASPDALWQLLRDPATIAACVPGASLTKVQDDAIEGEMLVSLGPVRARFAGKATLSYDDATLSGIVQGGGQDQASGTMLQASARFRVQPQGEGSVLAVDVEFGLRGALAQLAKGRVVDLLADEIAAMFAANLTARLNGETAPAVSALPGLRLAVRLALAWLRRILGVHG